MGRVICLIDGFNLFHAIDRLGDESLKWCDYWKLASRFVKPPNELHKVFYFTALAHWKPDGMHRHQKFIQALRVQGVDIVLGKFKKIKRYCKRCCKQYPSHEEKRTDVNIASYLFHLAYTNAFDTALIMSSDSDYTSAIELIRHNFPSKSVGIIFPVGQKHSDELANASTFFRYMKDRDLKKSLLSARILEPNGQIIIRPSRYDP